MTAAKRQQTLLYRAICPLGPDVYTSRGKLNTTVLFVKKKKYYTPLFFSGTKKIFPHLILPIWEYQLHFEIQVFKARMVLDSSLSHASST